MIQETLELGPIHEWLPGPMNLRLGMSGDRILKVETRFGYAFRGIEKSAIGRPLKSAQLRVSRIEPENALLIDRLFSELIEEITGTEISDRVHWIRQITSDLSDLNHQLKYLAKMARRLGINILFHAILKHRESLLDLLELLSGSRYGYYYLIPGGARYDLTEGFQERLESWVKGFQEDYSRIEALFCWTHSFQNRLRAMGQVLDQGGFGFVSNASVPESRLGHVSHVESRLMHALRKCLEGSVSIEKSLNEKRSGGEHLTPLGPGKGGAAKFEVESIRGPWEMEIEIDPEHSVKRLQVIPPSVLIQKAIEPALDGESLEDVPLILESLFFSVPEIDQ